nr:MAG TPA: Cyclic nucleotide-gated cation channel protein [Caudoviricetes sp.]
MEENRQLVGEICASIEELGNVIANNVAASHKDYERMIADLDNSITEMKKRLGNNCRINR